MTTLIKAAALQSRHAAAQLSPPRLKFLAAPCRTPRLHRTHSHMHDRTMGACAVHSQITRFTYARPSIGGIGTAAPYRRLWRVPGTTSMELDHY